MCSIIIQENQLVFSILIMVEVHDFWLSLRRVNILVEMLL